MGIIRGDGGKCKEDISRFLLRKTMQLNILTYVINRAII